MKNILRKFDTLYVYNNPVGYPIHKSRAAQPFLKGYWEVFCFVDLYRLAMSNFGWDIYIYIFILMAYWNPTPASELGTQPSDKFSRSTTLCNT